MMTYDDILRLRRTLEPIQRRLFRSEDQELASGEVIEEIRQAASTMGLTDVRAGLIAALAVISPALAMTQLATHMDRLEALLSLDMNGACAV